MPTARNIPVLMSSIVTPTMGVALASAPILAIALHSGMVSIVTILCAMGVVDRVSALSLDCVIVLLDGVAPIVPIALMDMPDLNATCTVLIVVVTEHAVKAFQELVSAFATSAGRIPCVQHVHQTILALLAFLTQRYFPLFLRRGTIRVTIKLLSMVSILTSIIRTQLDSVVLDPLLAKPSLFPGLNAQCRLVRHPLPAPS